MHIVVTPAEQDTIVGLYVAGNSITAIRKLAGRSEKAVRLALGRAGFAAGAATVGQIDTPYADEEDEDARRQPADDRLAYALRQAFAKGLEQQPSAAAQVDDNSLADRRRFTPVPVHSGCSSAAALCVDIA